MLKQWVSQHKLASIVELKLEERKIVESVSEEATLFRGLRREKVAPLGQPRLSVPVVMERMRLHLAVLASWREIILGVR
jgi:hypothetical protein